MRADSQGAIALACFGTLLATPAAAQTRMYLEGPTTALPGETLTYFVFLESPGLPVLVRGYQVTPPCLFSGLSMGSVDILVPPIIDVAHPDYIFHATQTATTSQGDCPDVNPRMSGVLLFPTDSPAVTDPVYLGQADYVVSADASGICTATVVPYPHPGSFLKDPESEDIPFVATGMTLTVGACIGTDACAEDGDLCTIDRCDPAHPTADFSGCAHEAWQPVFGDIVPAWGWEQGAMPQPDLDDILCVVDAFGAGEAWPSVCPFGDLWDTNINACGQDGEMRIDDIIKVLDTFGGVSACPSPCEPG